MIKYLAIVAVLLLAPAESNCQTYSFSVPLFDASTSTQTRPFAGYGSVGVLPATGCVPGSYADVTGSGLYRNSGTGACSWTAVGAGGAGGTGWIFTPTSASGTNYSGAVTGFTWTLGYVVAFTPDVANTGGVTLTINSTGKSLIRSNGNALVSGELPAAVAINCVYDGTVCRVVGEQLEAGGSGAIQITRGSGLPHTIDVTASVPLLPSVNAFTGANTFSSSSNQFKSLDIPATTVIPATSVKFWGDSLTQGTGATGGTIYPDQGVVYNSLPAQFHRLSGMSVDVWGRSANTSAQISTACTSDLKRVGWAYVIWAGTNDPGSSIAYTATVSNIQACIATNPGVPYFVLSPLPDNTDANTYAPSGSVYTSYFQPLRTLETSTFGAHFLDIAAYLNSLACGAGSGYFDATACTRGTPPNGGSGNPSLVSSGPHLNDLGYAIVTQQVYAALKAISGNQIPNMTSVNQMLGNSAGTTDYTAVDSGSANTLVVSTAPALIAPRDGLQICVTPNANSSGASTFSLNGNFPWLVVKVGGAAIASGDWVTTAKACFVFHGIGTTSQWELQNPQSLAYSNRRVCTIDNDTQSATALTAGQFSGACEISNVATIVEVDVWGGTGVIGGTVTTTGTSSINLQKYTPNGGGTTTLLSGALATASGQACALTSTSGTCANGNTSSSSITISTTALAKGDWVRVSAATPDSAQTWYRIAVIYALN